MKKYFLIYFLFFYYIKYSSATLVDGIVTLSWTSSGISPAVDRFLTNNTQIQFKILCIEPNTNETQGQIKKSLNKQYENTKVRISGRIGRIVGCLPLQSDTFMTTNQSASKDKDSRTSFDQFYQDLWKQMEQRTFKMIQVNCGDDDYLKIDEYSNTIGPEISPEKVAAARKETRKTRRAVDEPKTKTDEKKSPSQTALTKQTDKNLKTWADGYYFIEISPPDFEEINSYQLDVDVVVSMKNKRGGFLTADEYPALVFYTVMCAIYVLFAILWFISCAFYWRELRKIQFWIGGVILISMIEQTTFLAKYDTLNRNGYKVYYAIMTAEVLSCLKRTVFRMLVVIVALGYGIVKHDLDPLKRTVLAIGLLYFPIAITEASLRINTKNDETNNEVLIPRILLAIGDLIIYYCIVTGLISTTRQLRFKKKLVKLNAYRYFTNTIVFAIIASLLFMCWSLKSHFFTTCITNWREFWVDDAFWHILSSITLLVIMLLFRPSNNNQGDGFIPLLNQSDTDDNDGFDEKSEPAVFDSATMCKSSGSSEIRKQQQQIFLNHEANVSGSGIDNFNGNGTTEDALTSVKDNISTSIADQAYKY